MKNPRRHVFYSLTEDNPFLPEWYIENLKRDLDPMMVQRKVYGKWVAIRDEYIYYNYSNKENFKDTQYEWDLRHPIDISFDFNIGEGKPISANLSQYIDGKFHVGKTFAIHGGRTGDLMEDIGSYGLFENANKIRIFGDATGKNRDTRSLRSDYDIICHYLDHYKKRINWELCVPKKNPAIRARHNIVNAQCKNIYNEVRLFIYRDASKLDEGMRLTKLKSGGSYIEDDSKDYQHCTTALGYMIYFIKVLQEGRQSTVIKF